MKDLIYLLSVEEYEKYKDKIPVIHCWWWLRSTGSWQSLAADVYIDGSVDFSGYRVSCGSGAVRPAMRIYNSKEKIVFCGVTWVKIDTNLYISELPISFQRFDIESNNYKTSEIRKFLLDWYKTRKNL